MNPLAALRHHVTGAIERGEKDAIVGETDKFKSYTRAQVDYALLDCHEALRAGGYSVEHPYGRKVWAEIDALRARGLALSKNAPARRDPVWLSAHN